jgi:DNA-binding transcriptional LysR family regulator
MDLERLKMFLAIVDAGSMSAAARAVHLTQPALSKNVKQLEDSMGVALFDRRGRALVLTAAGRALVPRANALLEASARAVFDVGRCAQRAYFDVRLGAVDSVATFLVPRIVAPLKRAFAELALKLSTARTVKLLERVRAHDLDLAVVAHSGPPPDLRHTRIAPYRLRFVGLKELYPTLRHVRSEAELKRFPVVEIEPPPGDDGRAPDESCSYALASNVASVKALVLAGFGVGDLPDFMLTRDERRRLVAAELPHDPECALYLIAAAEWRGAVERRIEARIASALKRALL